MKNARFWILGLLALTLVGRAQDSTNAGWISSIDAATMATINSSNLVAQPQLSAQANTATGSPGYAETVTPDIQALANGLQNDPIKIFNYVHDHIRQVYYYGSSKGAELTLLEQCGNDFDQCSLLVALLTASGYSPNYGHGIQVLPYQATDGTANDLRHWLQLNLSDNTWTNVSYYLHQLAGHRGFPAWGDWGDNNHVGFHRVWVTLAIGGTNYVLDPAFKVSQPVAALAGFSLSNAMGSATISADLLSLAGGSGTTNYALKLSETSVRGKLAAYTTNLVNYLQSNCPNASVQDLMGGWQIVPSTNTTFSQSLMFSTYANSSFPIDTWSSIPTNFMSSISVSFAGTNETWYYPQLQGQGIALNFDGSGTARLWLGGTVVISSANTGSGQYTTVTLSAKHPYGGWDSVNHVPVDNGYADQAQAGTYQRVNASYALLYGFEPSVKWLNAFEQQLDNYRQQGYTNGSPQVVNATLNVMGLNWQLQTEMLDDIFAGLGGQLHHNHHRVGRMAQEAGNGYYVDVGLLYDSSCPATGYGAADNQRWEQYFDNCNYVSSAFEHGLIEQLQSSNLLGASTIKLLELANSNNLPVYLATSNNWSAISGSLVNYGTNISYFASLTQQGYALLLPQSGAITVAGSGTWKGCGYVVSGDISGVRHLGMIIGGGYNGGYVSDPTATINSDYTSFTEINQPTYFNLTPVSTFSPVTADPVDTANGTFEVENTDLSLGAAEPCGIALSRYYNGTRRANSAGGLPPGWVHNYCATANVLSAPQAALGKTTPAQMAAMLVTTYTVYNLYNLNQPDAKNWLTTALIAKWGVDQITKGGVSVSLGKDTIQFVQQPNGTFTPPANCTITLLQTNASYWLQARHGNTYKFNAAGYLTNIVNPYGQSLSLTYNASNWVQTIKDWTNRTFTFTYSGTPQRLASVTDGTRTVNYGYATNYNSSGDLTTFTDAEGQTNGYTYDTNHEITATMDAVGRMVVSNIYDGDGHVATQYTAGDASKAWHIFWSDWQTISQDPAGGQQAYFYDDNHRLIAQQDALGNRTQKFYDGQDHVVMAVTPMGETNQFIFDGNHNLLETIDPLGYSNQFFYDAQNNLTRALDANGNPTTYGYNAQFSMIGQTNGAGDWVSMIYNPNGTLLSRTDSGGATTFGYDSWGQLKTVIYPGNLGSVTNYNNVFGDMTNQVDARGFATAFQYNNRRQLTNAIAPTNITVKIRLDAVGNVASKTDARGNVTSNTWSATQHLLKTTLPALPQGAPSITNIYDNRDMLVQTIDPLNNSVFCTNDLVGRTVSVTDPLKRSTRFTFDANGRTLSTANAANATNRQTWDARGNSVVQTDGAGHSSLRVFDGVGNLVTLTNRNGNPWQFQYDAANRLTNTVTPLGKSSSVTYNHQGLPATVTDPLHQTSSLSYDAKGRLTNRTDNVGTTRYAFDANDNVTNVTENSLTNVWTYDAYNRVSSYQDVYGNVVQYRYDSGGNITNLIYPGNRTVTYAFDSQNHLTNVTDWAGRKTSITYDLAGHATTITRPNGSYRTMGYDSGGQMTNIMEQMSNGLPIAIFRFNWTNSANMAWEFAAPLPHSAAVPTRTMSYDADNRLNTVDANTVSMDDDGNLTSGPLTNDTFAAYVYDARNRLTSVGGETNFYDSAGNRIGLNYGTNRTVFVVNPNAALPQALMRIKNGVTNYYIYGPGLLYQITETAAGTNTLTYHYDYRGSTIALSADNTLVTDRIEYAAYGLTTHHVGTNDTPFLFNGRHGVMSDPNGLLAMRARYYNPFLCRFISADPSGFNGGLNCYAYANGNPIGFVDPFGLGAVHESTVDLSWFNAPTPQEQQTQQIWTGFINFATLGVANLVSSATTGQDLNGDKLNVGDALQQTEESLIFVGALAMSLPTDGASLEAEAILDDAGVLAANRGIPNTGKAFFDRAAVGTQEFQSFLGQVRGAGFKVRPSTMLPEGNPAYFRPSEKTFFYNPNTMTHIDTLHEGIHLQQFINAGNLRTSGGILEEYESAAYGFEYHLGLEHGFSSEYMEYLEGMIKFYGK